MSPNEFGHDPVLLKEVMEVLRPAPGETYVDCTLGRAGHASAIGATLGAGGRIIGIDVDPENLGFAQKRLAEQPAQPRLFQASFAELLDVWNECGQPKVDCILADLGLSTNQLLKSNLGLSFSRDEALDMRIDPRIEHSAAHLVNTMEESALADVLYELAQERCSRRIARKIVEARRISPIQSTARLAEIVRSAIPLRGPKAREKIDPATRTFLALRMKVNREIENLEALLEQAPKVMKAGGRLAVISFQSTEDRIVKQAFRSMEQTGLVTLLTKKPVTPSDAEIHANPRSRSAKLRAVQTIKC